MENEIWMPVKMPVDLTCRFEISSEGNLKRVGYFTKQKKVWKPDLILKISKAGKYMKIGIKHKGKVHNLSIHRLVCHAFHPNPENKPQTNHINGIKHDNRAVNLEWCDQSENIRHAQSIGLMKYAKPKIKVYKRREDKLHKPPTKIVNIETGEIFVSLDFLCNSKGLNIKSVRRQISGERYCYVPYRYVGRENDVRFAPVKIPKAKPPKKERPPKKVYVPHPLVLKKMVMYDMNGNELQVFDSSSKAAEYVGSNPDTFRRAIRKSPNNFTKGYVWKYAS